MVTAPTSTLDDLLAYLGASPTPFHAVVETRLRLVAAGFQELDERAPWEDLTARQTGVRYFVVSGETSLIAFVLPHDRKISGFRIVGAHTDSPNLRLKPEPDYLKEGYAQLGVEVYGGALLSSWLDRDLGLAGRLIVREKGEGEETRCRSHLVRIARPICRVAQLAIHLDRDVNDGLKLNRQEHLAPIFGLGAGDDVLSVCAREAGVVADDVVAHDLMLFDVALPTRGGRSEELFFSGRLDNLAMCHAGTTALLLALGAAEAGDVVPVLALFDHEEVGSESATGAHSAFLPRVLERISLSTGASRDAHLRSLAGSLCVSADMAHAVHPNYAERHEARHKPVLNGGPVIKTNAQQRYATSGPTAALFRELAREADVPVQEYAHRTDLPCGTTIGPITSSLLGIRTVDVGNPMLSMHSIRELGGCDDPDLMVRVMRLFFVCRDSA